MGITAKELAEKLGISAAAVSMALNNKPGVSTETRKKVRLAAEKYGYDFTKIKPSRVQGGTIYFIIYKKNGAVVDETPFFIDLSQGVADACKKAGYKLRILYIYEADASASDPGKVIGQDCIGILLLATEMVTRDLRPFLDLTLPVVVIDSYFESFSCDTVVINNEQGAYLATRHLILKYHTVPGHLKSSFPINNFRERDDGMRTAIHAHGLSTTQSMVLEMTPSMSGAYADMKEFLTAGNRPARCFFADNDLIAVGAMRALKEAGYRIPEDVAIVGFDNQTVSQFIEPALTTINVPKKDIGRMAVLRLLDRIRMPEMAHCKIEIETSLVDRFST